MTEVALKIISDAMQEMELAYGLGRFNGQADPYFVGEYQETPSDTEDGLQESTFMLTGFTRGEWLGLERAKKKIKNYFNRVSGKTAIVNNGSAVAVFYENALIVPTNDAELKRMQINLEIKEWEVI